MKINLLAKKVAALLLSLTLLSTCFTSAIPSVSAAGVESNALSAPSAAGAATLEKENNSWNFENEIISAKVSFDDGSLSLESLYNKEAGREYITAGEDNYLFSYKIGEYVTGGTSRDDITAASNDQSWTLKSATISDITMNESDDVTTVLGKSLSVELESAVAELTVTAVFEIYDGRSGMRYQTHIKNNASVKRIIIESDVISMSLPNEAHYIHYVEAGNSSSNPNSALNSVWKSTAGALAKNTGRNALCVYGSGDGWWMMPETNWRTQLGPDTYGQKPSDTKATYEFATTSCFSGDSKVKVTTNPGSMKLTLKAGEEFQYIGVNFTVFSGDVVDGKMAAEEHFQKRFKYHDTTTILNTNDWDYLGNRTYEYFDETIVPLAKRAGVDMVMIDDLWNVDRDSLTAKPSLRSLGEISDLITSNGMMFGLWYSMNGADHNNGRDLADPVQLAEKIEMVKELATTYNVSHQMIDLTEFWQNTSETTYSSPCDNVYRKNVMVNSALNEVVEENPGYMVKFTNEIDVYPTQGNRQNGLLHIVNNGWLVHNAGLSGGMAAGANAFGYLPLSSVYTGGSVTGSIAEYYHYMFARNVKLNEDPGVYWTDKGIEIMSMFNSWRGGERVTELTDLVKRPTYLGAGWDGDNASAWSSGNISNGPYSWMYINDESDRALLISTSYKSEASKFTADTRWFDETKTYMVADVTLDDTGSFTYGYKGIYSGSELVENGFEVDLTENSSGGKAYWFEAVSEEDMQVIYADENIADYSSSVSGDTMTLTLTGEAGATATVIVGDSSNNKGRVISVSIGESGSSVLTIPRSKLYDPSTAEEPQASAVRYEVEELFETDLGVYDPAKVSLSTGKPDDGASIGASGGIYRFIEFQNVGDSFGLPVTVSAEGTYVFRVAFKSHNNQALAALGINGEIISETFDLSQGVPINKHTVKEIKVTLKAGENILNVFCMGKGGGNSSSTASFTLRTDYLEYEPLIDASPATTPAGDISEEIDCSNGSKLTVSGDSVKLSAQAPASYMTVPVTAQTAGEYSITANFKGAADGAIVQAYLGTNSISGSADLYDTNGGEISLGIDSLIFEKNETKYIDLVIMGRNAANTTGYAVTLDSIAITASPVVEVAPSGALMKAGETADLKEITSIKNVQPAYSSADSLKYQVMSESGFDIVEVNDGVLTANNIGTAVVRISHKSAVDAYADYTVSVVSDGLSKAVSAVMLSINQIGRVSYTDDCKQLIDNARSAYSALGSSDKKLVENYYILTRAEAVYDSLKTTEEAGYTPSAINYIEDLEFVMNTGSTFRKGSCPSGSHQLQFTQDGTVYSHGFGFEPTDSTPGTMLIPIPEGTDYFYAKIGIDVGMSAASANYDQANVVTVSVDGTEMAKTGKILKNYQNGGWVDNSFEIEFAVPSGAKWLLIQNDAGTNRICDHIIFADARMENSAAAEVERLIDSVTPANINISRYSTETGEKIRAAEQAYYALDAGLRKYVAGYTDLINYRITHASFGILDTDIGAGLTAAQLSAVAEVEALIAAIPGKDVITETDRARVDAAKAAYDALESNVLRDCVTSVTAIYMGGEWIDEGGRPGILLGDLDSNGSINVSDVVALRQLIMSGNWTAAQLAAGDMDENNSLSVNDVVALRKKIMNQAN